MIIPSSNIIKDFKETHGAMSVAEGVALFNLAFDAPKGAFLELGTHKGKSSIMIAAAIPIDCVLNLVEPEFKDSEWAKDVAARLINIGRPNFKLIPDYSTSIIGNYESLAFCFVDSGSHQDGLPMQEVRMLEDRMVEGGIISFHDFNSQFKEVREAADYLVGTGKYEYIPIDWDKIVRRVDENNLEEGNITWHHTELKHPTFLGAVKRK